MKFYKLLGANRNLNRAEILEMLRRGGMFPVTHIHDDGALPTTAVAIKDHPDFKSLADYDAAVVTGTPKPTTPPAAASTTTTATPAATTKTKKSDDWHPLAYVAAAIIGVFAVWGLLTVFGSPKLGWGKGIEQRVSELEAKPSDTAAADAAKLAAEEARKAAAAAQALASGAARQSGELATANLCPNGTLDNCIKALKSQGVEEKFGREACAPTCVN